MINCKGSNYFTFVPVSETISSIQEQRVQNMTWSQNLHTTFLSGIISFSSQICASNSNYPATTQLSQRARTKLWGSCKLVPSAWANTVLSLLIDGVSCRHASTSCCTVWIWVQIHHWLLHSLEISQFQPSNTNNTVLTAFTTLQKN